MKTTLIILIALISISQVLILIVTDSILHKKPSIPTLGEDEDDDAIVRFQRLQYRNMKIARTADLTLRTLAVLATIVSIFLVLTI